VTACFVFRDLTSLQQNLSALFNIIFLQFVMTAAGTEEEQAIDELKPTHGGKLKRIPLFFVAKRLT
jgi:etoposide-induced 2.4 mRNA